MGCTNFVYRCWNGTKTSVTPWEYSTPSYILLSLGVSLFFLLIDFIGLIGLIGLIDSIDLIGLIDLTPPLIGHLLSLGLSLSPPSSFKVCLVYVNTGREQTGEIDLVVEKDRCGGG